MAPTYSSEPALLDWDLLQQMFARAHTLSDLRVEGSTPFRLEVRIYIPTAENVIQGRYLGLWQSKGQWRQEITLPRFHLVTVRTGLKEARVRNSNHLPGQVVAFLQGWEAALPRAIPKKRRGRISERRVQGQSAACAEVTTGDGPTGASRVYCFDPKSDVLLQQSWSETNTVWEYSDLAGWNGHQIPREMRVVQDGKLEEEARVVTLEALDSKDAALIAVPPGAEVWPACESPKPASMLSGPMDLNDPVWRLSSDTSVLVWVEVAVDGRADDVILLKPRLAPEVEQGMSTFIKKRWRFQPSQCGDVKRPSYMVLRFERH